LGDADVVGRLRRHPVARALRVDKLTLAALEATLRGPIPPAVAAVHADPAQLRARCDALADELLAAGLACDVVASEGVVGGGGAPAVRLAGWALRLPSDYTARLRSGDPCVVGRTENDACLL